MNIMRVFVVFILIFLLSPYAYAQFYDEETGFHQNGHRDYDPSTGRYLEADPIGLDGGMNLYGYADENSVMMMDPEGLFAAVSCVRCGERGMMICKVNEEGVVGPSFPANAGDNNPSGNLNDPYGPNGPLAPGTYDLPVDNSPDFHRKLPSPTNNGVPGQVMSPGGNLRAGVRIHSGCTSRGCVTLGPNKRSSENELNALILKHANRGGVKLVIYEYDDCCNLLRHTYRQMLGH